MLGMLKNLLGTPGVQAILLAGILIAISFVVKKTKTKKDDAIWEIVRGAMFNAFNLAEKIIPDGTSNAGLRKIDEALKVFNSRIVDALGRNASKSELDQAKAMWSEMAFEIKKG